MGMGDLVALADAANVGPAGLAVGSAIRLFTLQDARVCGDAHDDVPIQPTMYKRLAIAIITTVSRRFGTLNGDDGEKEQTWLLELASAWARLDAAWGSHAW
jgi:hypothetical protein